MASKQTEHLKLCQREAEDEVLRADFNVDNTKIDAAVSSLERKLDTAKAETQRKLDTVAAEAQQKLDEAEARLDAAKADVAGLTKYAVGSYTGNGVAGGQVIQLGFTPEAVIVWPQAGATCASYSSFQVYGCMALAGLPSQMDGRMLLKVVDGGFQVYRDGPHVGPNDLDTVYFYLALYR